MPTKYIAIIEKIRLENPEAYSVQYTDNKPGECGYAPYAVITTYSNEHGAAANREYIAL